MKVYVATAFAHRDHASKWMRMLEEKGIEITFDWTECENPVRGELELTLDRQRELAELDSEGVADSDITWIVAPESGGCGCWFEMGYALGLGKKVIVSGHRRTIFTALEEIEYFDTNKLAYWRILRLAEIM